MFDELRLSNRINCPEIYLKFDSHALNITITQSQYQEHTVNAEELGPPW